MAEGFVTLAHGDGAAKRRWLALALAWSAQAAGAAVFLGLPAIGPQFADAYAMDLRTLGVAFAALLLGGGLSILPWGALADRVGARAVMGAGIGLAGAALGIAAAVPMAGVAVACLVLAGVGSGSASAAGNRSVLAWFPTSERGLAMGIRQTAMPVGAAAGALGLPLIAAASSVPATLAILGAGCAITALAVALTLSEPRAHAVAQAAPPPEPRTPLLADGPLRRVVAASALLATSQLAIASFLVVFLQSRHGWDVPDAAALLAAIQLGGAAARPIVGRWSDLLHDRAGLMAGVAVVAALTLVHLAVVADESGAHLVLGVVMAGVATLSWNGLGAIAAGELAPANRSGAALGWQTSAVFFGGAAVAPLFAALVSSTSWTAGFGVLAIPALAAAVLLWPLRRRHGLEHDDRRDLMQRALASMSSAICLIDVREPSHPIVYVNASYERLTGYSPAEALGAQWTMLEGPETDPETARLLRDAVDRGEELRVPVRHYRRDGTAYWSELLMAPVYAEDRAVTHYMGVQKDVTARVEAEERAAHLAYHDTLTGLPNRAQFQEHLAMALARCERSGTAAALLFLDLDGFKNVNDRYGHEAGDRLLLDVARRWRSVGRRGDVLARYGGDEFLLLMPDLPLATARETALAASARYAGVLRLPFDVHGTRQATTVAVSIGVALYPDDAETPSELLLAADEAMYAVKRARR